MHFETYKTMIMEYTSTVEGYSKQSSTFFMVYVCVRDYTKTSKRVALNYSQKPKTLLFSNALLMKILSACIKDAIVFKNSSLKRNAELVHQTQYSNLKKLRYYEYKILILVYGKTCKISQKQQ